MGLHSTCRGLLLVLWLFPGCQTAGQSNRFATPTTATSCSNERVRILAESILDLRARETESSDHRYTIELDQNLGALFNNDSTCADAASLVLLGYYLGEARNEDLYCNLLTRGKRLLPLLRRLMGSPRPKTGRGYPTLFLGPEAWKQDLRGVEQEIQRLDGKVPLWCQ